MAIQELILCSAIARTSTNTDAARITYKDPSCWESHGKTDDIYDIELGRRHADIIQRFKGQLDTTRQGFYTSYGRYVDRKEAYAIAEAAGQIVRGPHVPGTLFSEDLW